MTSTELSLAQLKVTRERLFQSLRVFRDALKDTMLPEDSQEFHWLNFEGSVSHALACVEHVVLEEERLSNENTVGTEPIRD